MEQFNLIVVPISPPPVLTVSLSVTRHRKNKSELMHLVCIRDTLCATRPGLGFEVLGLPPLRFLGFRFRF
jgi:hypothetical protein